MAEKPDVTVEMYAAVENGKISSLLETFGEQIKRLADFKPPRSRDEAIDLLVRANIAPDAPSPGKALARPDVFRPMITGTMRWSRVEIAALDADEVAELVREAWTQIVPRKVSRPYLASL